MMAWTLEGLSCGEILGLATAVISISFVWFFVIPLTHWRRKGIPHVSAVPLLGSLKDSLFQKVAIAEEYQKIYREMEGYRYAGFHKFMKPSIILRDPELIKEVMVKEFSSFHDNDFDVTLSMDPMMGRNLFFTNGERWKRMRTTLTPAFSSGKIKTIFPLILDVAEDLKRYLDEEKVTEIELKEISDLVTTNLVASCAFGIKIDTLRNPGDEFRATGREMVEPTPARGLAQLLFMNSSFLARMFGIKFIPPKCANFFRGVVRDVVSMRQRSGETRNDFLKMIVLLKCAGKLGEHENEADDTNEKGVTKDEADLKELKGPAVESVLNDPESLDDVTAQLLGFFLDGQETSAALNSFTLFELAHNPDVQEKLRAEVTRVKAVHGGTLTYEALQEMPFLEMVQQESLRKYPPAPFTPRRCSRRYYLPPADEKVSRERGGFWVDAGTPVLIPIYAIHHDPKNYPEPEVFNPERFSKEAEKGKGGTYLPFGDGPRMCIGNRFARLQNKAVVAEMVCNYKLKPCIEKTPVPIQFDPKSLILHSLKGLWVTLEKI